MTMLLGTLNTMRLYRGEAPNKAYNTQTGQMTNYQNQPSEGIDFSALDLARLASWLEVLGCMYPKHRAAAEQALLRWNFCRFVANGQMYGAYVDPVTNKDTTVQEGRVGYEQYAGKALERLGFELPISASYGNPFAGSIDILGVAIPYDTRDRRTYGANTYVVTESYALDVMEFGLDPVNRRLLDAIFQVQRKRWRETGIVTAVTEDHIDRPPHFLYSTIWANGVDWNVITDTNEQHPNLRTISTKAAISLAVLFPDDPYAEVLRNSVESAYDPAKGWFAGVYEGGLGYNRALTVNTNGIVLQAILFKLLGPVHEVCDSCGRKLLTPVSPGQKLQANPKCSPGRPRVTVPDAPPTTEQPKAPAAPTTGEQPKPPGAPGAQGAGGQQKPPGAPAQGSGGQQKPPGAPAQGAGGEQKPPGGAPQGAPGGGAPGGGSQQGGGTPGGGSQQGGGK